MTTRAAELVLGEASTRRLEELGAQLGNDRWAVFLGAGVSKSADLPDWPDLVEAVGRRYDLDWERVDPDNFPLFFGDGEQTSDDFWPFIESKVCVPTAPSRLQRTLMELPFELFVTFNYDCSLDGLHSELPGVGTPKLAVYPSFLPVVDLRERRMIYLHGKCDCAAEEGARLSGDRVVLTLASYQSAYSETSRLPQVLESVFDSYRVLFVGVGFKEWRIKRILDLVQQREKESGGSSSLYKGRHLAIASTDIPPIDRLPGDMDFKGLTYGIAPIFYFNPRGGRHEGLPPILEWLSERAQAQGVLGNVVGPG